MKGKILDFSIAENQGVISGDDGARYTFIGKEWKASTPPGAGLRVDYDTNELIALAVYLDQEATVSKSTQSDGNEVSYEGFYKSSDDKSVSGVCAGLGHKWKISIGGLRFATFLVTFFLSGLPLVLYIICALVFPAKPTKNVD